MLLQDNSPRWKRQTVRQCRTFSHRKQGATLCSHRVVLVLLAIAYNYYFGKKQRHRETHNSSYVQIVFSRTLFKYPHYTVFSRLRYCGHELESLDRKYQSILSNGDRRTEQLKKSFLHSFSPSLPLPLWISHTLSLTPSLSLSHTHTLSLFVSHSISRSHALSAPRDLYEHGFFFPCFRFMRKCITSTDDIKKHEPHIVKLGHAMVHSP